jgi:endothelin-converting enzyme/putative endopeptidase
MKSLSRTLVTSALVAVLSVISNGQSVTSLNGFNPDHIDATVAPGQNFYRHANGRWINKAASEIKNGMTSVGFHTELGEQTDAIIGRIVTSDSNQTITGQRIHEFYQILRSTNKGAGITPIMPLINTIQTATTPAQVAEALGKLHRMGLKPCWGILVEPYAYNASKTVLHIDQGTLSVQGPAYYTNPKNAALLGELSDLIGATIEPFTGSKTKAMEISLEIIKAETAIAIAVQEQRGTVALTPERAITLAKFHATYPNIPIKSYLKGLGTPNETMVVVSTPKTIAPIDGLFAQHDLATIKNLIIWSIIKELAPYLDDSVYASHFKFFQGRIKGVTTSPSSDARALVSTKQLLGVLIAKEYADTYIGRPTLKAVGTIVEKVKAGLAKQFEESTWMSRNAKRVATSKINKMHISIAYPEKAPSAMRLKLDPSATVVENVLKVKAHLSAFNLKQVGRATDRRQWPNEMNVYALTPTAMAEPKRNVIIIGVALLQPPLFNINAEETANLGSLGCVIGHEIGHLFDNRGWTYDDKGNFRNWFSTSDQAYFLANAERLKNQIREYQLLPGVYANPELTLRETMADVLGASMAFKAAIMNTPDIFTKKSAKSHGLTEAQVFFYAYASSYRWCEQEDSFKDSLVSDSHAAAEFSVNCPLANMDGFRKAFSLDTGLPMTIPHEKAVVMW